MKALVGGFKGLIVHHSLTKDGNTVSWDEIKKYHMTAPEYMMDDIGYHMGIERINGMLSTLTGRDLRYEGGHTKGHNDCFGLCIVGNFDLASPDPELMGYTLDVTLAIMRMIKITPDQVWPHNKYASYKSCPGTQFPWESFVNRIKYNWR